MSKPVVLKFLFNLIICHPPERKLLPYVIILKKRNASFAFAKFPRDGLLCWYGRQPNDSLSQSPLAVGLQFMNLSED